MTDLSIQPDPYIKAVADSLVKAREEYEEESRKELLRKIDALCSMYRHRHGGWDVENRGFEKALDLLSEIYEELRD